MVRAARKVLIVVFVIGYLFLYYRGFKYVFTTVRNWYDTSRLQPDDDLGGNATVLRR